MLIKYSTPNRCATAVCVLAVCTTTAWSGKKQTCLKCPGPVKSALPNPCPGPNPAGLGTTEGFAYCCYMSEAFHVQYENPLCRAMDVYVYAWAYCGHTASSGTKYHCSEDWTDDGHVHSSLYANTAACTVLNNPCGLAGDKCVVSYNTPGAGTIACASTTGTNPSHMGYNGCNTKWQSCSTCRTTNCPIYSPVGTTPGDDHGGPQQGQAGCTIWENGCADPNVCPSRLLNGTRGMCRCDWYAAGGNP